MEMMGN